MSKFTRPTTSGAIVARNIRAALDARGMSRNALAAAVGMPGSTLYAKLGHRPGTFSVAEVADIAFALAETDEAVDVMGTGIDLMVSWTRA